LRCADTKPHADFSPRRKVNMRDPMFVLGVDLDGVVADFYTALRPIAAEWVGLPVERLSEKVSWGLRNWGIKSDEDYLDLHRFAVTQRNIFKEVKPIPGAAPVLRRLDARDDIRIRIITHRLFTKYTHQIATRQTTEWLDNYGIPYWDLCFMKEKDKVGASVYIEDSPSNIEALRHAKKKVIIFSNSTNIDVAGERANSWDEVEILVLKLLEEWKIEKAVKHAHT
jgi:5'(3')-deoxyribonucleotidase